MPSLTAQQKSLFERLTQDRQQNATILEKLSMKGIKTNLTEKYSENSHFIYELLQNADDAKATQARLVLTPTGIIFAHNGTIHFSLTDPATEIEDNNNNKLGHINAITAIGNSNKSEAQIGKFGLGFKAVFQCTRSPEIYDPPFFFKIQQLIVPILLPADHPARQARETLFYLPFDNPTLPAPQAFSTILNKLAQLPQPLLFLRHLKQINWLASNGSQGSYTQTVRHKNDYLNLQLQLNTTITQKIFNQQTITTHFLIISRELPTLSPKPFANQISLAYLTESFQNEPIASINANQNPQATFPAYCFFPTKENTHLHFIVHAPFLLTDNREGIKRDELWNQTLIQRLAQLTADSLIVLKQQHWLTENFFATVLPLEAEYFPTTHLFRSIYEAVINQLKSPIAALLPTCLDNYVNKNKAYLANTPELRQLINSSQLSQLIKQDNAQWIFPQLSSCYQPNRLADYLKKCLFIPELNGDTLIQQLTKEFLQQQSDEWLIQLYSYLLEQIHTIWKSIGELKQKPLLRLTDEQITAAYNRAGKIQAYLPTDDDDSEYPTVKSIFMKNDRSKQFLLALGLDKPKEYEEINYYILPRYRKAKNLDATTLQKDFRKLLNYFFNCPEHQQAEYLNKLKKIPLCRVVDNPFHSRQLALPTVVYFEKEYLQDYFTHYPNALFLASECYQEFEPNKVEIFLKKLGIEDKPRLIKIKAKLSQQEREHIHQGKCTRDYYLFSQYTYDYDLEGLDNFLINMNLAKSKLLWQLLLKLLEGHWGQEIFQGQYHWFYRRNHYYHFDAKFLITLRQTAWLYDQSGNYYQPIQMSLAGLAGHYAINTYAAKILIEKLQVPVDYFSIVTREQAEKLENYAVSDELFQLARENGKNPIELLQRFKCFLAQNEPQAKAQRQPATTSTDTASEAFTAIEQQELAVTTNAADIASKKQALLHKHLKQQLVTLTKIEQLQAHIARLEKYSFKWFNLMLELEYYFNNDSNNPVKAKIIKFGKIKQDSASPRLLILQNPSSYLSQTLEEMTSLVMKILVNGETKHFALDIINVKELTLWVRLKAPLTEIEKIDFGNLQQVVIEIKNPTFLLEQLKLAFQQLPFEDTDSLQAHLPPKIEFIFGPPGTGKTTYLVKEKILPLLNLPDKLKVLVLTPTNKAADILVKKLIAALSIDSAAEKIANCLEPIVRFGVTSDLIIENLGLLQHSDFDVSRLSKCIVITTIARFLYDHCQNAALTCQLKDYPWDMIMVDEASMIPLAQIAYLLHKQAFCRFVISGDPFQIQPIVVAEQWRDENIYTLVNLRNFQSPTTVPHQFSVIPLQIQYRSVLPLGMLFSQFSYQGKLRHHRQGVDNIEIKLDETTLKTITVITYPLNSVESIYRPQRLAGGGTYHIYSAILTVELLIYWLRQFIHHELSLWQSGWKIGVICPYVVQITLVEKMLTALVREEKLPIQIVTGTVHSFQGEEFDMILALLNVPPHISPNIFINRQNILNVVISRARDYLVLMVPDRLEGLEQLKRLKMLLRQSFFLPYYQEFTAMEIEQALFKQSNYIHANSLVVAHQQVNVYAGATKRYEIRWEDNAIDVQLG